MQASDTTAVPATATTREEPPELRYFDAGGVGTVQSLCDLWNFRGLAWTLAVRDVRVQYRQSLLGISWALARPFLTMLVFIWLFGMIGRVPADRPSDYGLLLFAGLLPWQWFTSCVSVGSNSLVANEHLITKVFFPRWILVLSPLLVAGLDFILGLLLLAGMMVWKGHPVGLECLLAPLFVLLAAVSAIAMTSWLAAMNALYRDVRHVVPFALQLGMLVSPVVYQSDTILSARVQTIASINPMATAINGFRYCLLGTPAPAGIEIIISVISCLLLLLSGVWFFGKVESTIADRV
ncbi:MAG: ABC transporter permease [Planctomycetota bacterium]